MALAMPVPGVGPGLFGPNYPDWYDPSDKGPWPERETGIPGLPKPEPMGASSGGASGFESWPPGSNWGGFGVSQHHQKGKVNTGSGTGGPYKTHPNFGYTTMSVQPTTGQTQEQSEEEFNQAWKDQGIGASIVGTVAKWTGIALVAATVGWIAGPAIIGAALGIGSAIARVGYGVASAVIAVTMRFGSDIYDRIYSFARSVAFWRFPTYGCRIQILHLVEKISGIINTIRIFNWKGVLRIEAHRSFGYWPHLHPDCLPGFIKAILPKHIGPEHVAIFEFFRRNIFYVPKKRGASSGF